MTKVIVIHGTKGSPSINWFPWLKRELDSRRIPCFIPTMPTPERQTLQYWLSAFDQQVGSLDESSILIGHSIGATFVLRLLERANVPIQATFLVAGVLDLIGNAEYDSLNSSFVADPYDWQQIKRNAGKIWCVAGDNDPYVPRTQVETIAGKLGVPLDLIPGGGHLNAEFGFDTFPALLDGILNKRG